MRYTIFANCRLCRVFAADYGMNHKTGVPCKTGRRTASTQDTLDYLALPVHHNTFPIIRHLDSEANEIDSYSRWSETKASV